MSPQDDVAKDGIQQMALYREVVENLGGEARLEEGVTGGMPSPAPSCVSLPLRRGEAALPSNPGPHRDSRPHGSQSGGAADQTEVYETISQNHHSSL